MAYDESSHIAFASCWRDESRDRKKMFGGLAVLVEETWRWRDGQGGVSSGRSASPKSSWRR